MNKDGDCIKEKKILKRNKSIKLTENYEIEQHQWETVRGRWSVRSTDRGATKEGKEAATGYFLNVGM